MRPFRSHGDGRFTREQLHTCGEHVVFEDGVRIWHPETVSLGENVYLGHDAMLKGYYKNTLTIGDNTWVGQGVFFHSAGGITIGNAVGIGPFVKILTSSHGEAGREVPILDSPLVFAPVAIEDDVDIGVGSTILPGVRIGRGAQIGAGAVVTRDVPAYAVVAGNPARILRTRGEPTAKRVLIVGGGPFQVPLIRRAASLGLDTVVVDRAADAPGMRRANHAVVVDTTNIAGVVEVAHRYRVTAVLTAASDMALTAVSAVAVARELPGNPPESVDICRDKLQTFDAMTRAGLPVPLTLTVSCLEDVHTAVDRMAYPCVIKPRSAAGGRGVSIVQNAGQLEGALDRALKYAVPGQGVLAQAYVGGTSVGVEAVFWRGELVRAFVMDDQYQEGSVSPVGHALPSRLPVDERRQLVTDVQRIGRALGLVDGPANFDLRRENGQTVLIECNARLGGSGITDLIRIACDVDLSEVALRTASGEAPNLGPDDGPVQPTAARLILLPGRGRLQVDTDKLETLRQAPDVKVLSLTARPGEPAQLIVDRWTLIGVVLVVAETPEAAIERAAELGQAVASIVSLVGDKP